MSTLSQRDVERWLSPHPVWFAQREARWKLSVKPIGEVSKVLFSCWRVSKDGKSVGDKETGQLRTVAWWADRARAGRSPLENHYLQELARTWAPLASTLTVIALRKPAPGRLHRLVLFDGNHRMIALSMLNNKDRQLKHVGVLVRV